MIDPHGTTKRTFDLPGVADSGGGTGIDFTPVVDAGGTIYQTTFNYNGDDAVTHLTVIDLDSATDPVTIDLAGSPVNHALVGPDGTVYQTTTTNSGDESTTHVTVIAPEI